MLCRCDMHSKTMNARHWNFDKHENGPLKCHFSTQFQLPWWWRIQLLGQLNSFTLKHEAKLLFVQHVTGILTPAFYILVCVLQKFLEHSRHLFRRWRDVLSMRHQHSKPMNARQLEFQVIFYALLTSVETRYRIFEHLRWWVRGLFWYKNPYFLKLLTPSG